MEQFILQYMHPFIAWLHLHPALAGVVTFFISFAESLALIGLIVPGAIIMSAIGALIGAGVIPLWETMLFAAFGAITGDLLSYKIGHRYKTHIKELWPFTRFPHLLKQAESFFHRHGGKSVLLGRFIGPMRPIIPLIAGMLQMPTIRFLCVCVIAGLLWAPVYMFPGLLIGAASQQLAPETATRFLMVVLLALVLLWLTAWLFRCLLRRTFYRISHWMYLLWRKLKRNKKMHWFVNFLQDPNRPNHYGQLLLFCIAFLLLFAFLLFAISTLHQGIVTIFNHPIHQFFRNIHTAIGTKTMILISFMGYRNVLTAIAFLMFLWLLASRHIWTALHWLALTILTVGAIGISKLLIYSPRPDGLIYVLQGNSFPSGHTSFSFALYSFLAFLIARRFPRHRQRHYIYFGFLTLCVLIALSRLYLGAHWFTDVFAGMLLGLTLTCFTILSFKRKRARPVPITGLLCVTLIGFVLTLPWQIMHNYREMEEIYTPYWPTYSANLESWWSQAMTHTPPLYRLNRLGEPVELMNIQWLGELSNIENFLLKNGWQKIPRLSLIDLVNRIASQHKEAHYPILPPLYLGQAPAFAAVKRLDASHIVFLQLWSANIEFVDSDLPLWVGTVSYQIPRNRHFWLHAKYLKKLMKLSSPPDILIPSLENNFTYHILHYPELARPKHIPLYQWKGGSMLIKPSGE